MKPIITELNNSLSIPLYIQLYENIKNSIVAGEIQQGEKLPSLRSISQNFEISITTAQLAYNQLLVEGYIVSKPQSGYYAAQGVYGNKIVSEPAKHSNLENDKSYHEKHPYIYDPDCFDFNKWKKCSSTVFNEYHDQLLYESNPQGEYSLRFEISKYLYSSRGVKSVSYTHLKAANIIVRSL